MTISIKFTDLDSQLESVGANKGGASKFPESPYLGVGTHNVTITEAIVKGPNKMDPTWIDLELSVQAVNGKSRRGYFAIPTSKLTYGKFDSKREFYKFRELLKAVGVSDAAMREDMSKVVDTLVNNSASLADLQITATVGYDATHPVKTEKGEWILANYKGEEHPIAVGKTFPDRDSVLAFAALKAIWVQKGPTITKVSGVEGSTPLNTAPVKKAAKKPTENSPF